MDSPISVCPLCFLLNTADQNGRRNYFGAKLKTYFTGLLLAQSVSM